MQPLKNDRWRIPKSRYASNSTYISTDSRLRPEYLDPDLVIDESIKAQLMAGGMDDRLATHFAHLFIRDPLVVFKEDLETLDLSKTDHFENLQSTNWQHMRFKPPPADNSIGWRVEFRSMEVQVTDFENAAFAVFVVLVTRAILSFDLNFYIPITRVDENMEAAHARDAVLYGRFYFRKNPFPVRAPRAGAVSSAASGTATPTAAAAGSRPPTPTGPVEDEYTLMSIDEIINGTARCRDRVRRKRRQRSQGGRERVRGPPNGASDTTTPAGSPPAGAAQDDTGTHNEAAAHDPSLKPSELSDRDDDAEEEDDYDFPGLVPLVESYLDAVNVDVTTRCEIDAYLGLVSARASGRLCTAARWIREYVAGHKDYKQDSVVSEVIAHDLVGAVVAVCEREARGEGFKGLGIPGLGRFLGGFRGACDPV